MTRLRFLSTFSLRSCALSFLLGVSVSAGLVACSGADAPASGRATRPAEPGVFAQEGDLPVGTPGTSRVELRPTDDSVAASDDSVGAFRTVCEFSHMSHDDPIVQPRLAGRSHLHAFFGNTAADANSTAGSLRSTGNSTCRGGVANRTSYWVPALLDASGAPIVPEVGNFYYKSGYRGVAAESIHPFPDGLRMVAGDPKASSEQGDDVGYWTCEQGGPDHVGSIPDCDPGDHVIMHVEFPQCWDGKNLDSTDHRSHVVYPADGDCPGTHPVAIPAITFNIVYRVPSGGTAGMRLSSDTYDASRPGGFSAHGDWFDGWDPDIVKVWVRNCVNAEADCFSHLIGDGREMYFEPD